MTKAIRYRSTEVLAVLVVRRNGRVEVSTDTAMFIVNGPADADDLAYLSKVVDAAAKAAGRSHP